MPDFVKGMNQLIAGNDLDTVKTYLRWQTLHAAAPMLPKAFVEENFDFYGKTLRGAKELRPRWKRCVQYTDNDLGEALGQAYVAETFPPEAKAAHAEDGARAGSRAQDGHHRAFLDERRDQEAGAGQAVAHRQQDRLSQQVARLQLAQHRARRCHGQFACAPTSSSSTASSTRSASRWTATNGA